MTASSDIKVAMVTGHHEYDVIDFQRMLRGIPDIDFYPQHMEDFVIDSPETRAKYDVIAFYNYQQDPALEGDSKFASAMKNVLGALGETDQGIFMLHHSLTAFPGWQYWLDICGMAVFDASPKPGPMSRVSQNLRIEVVDPNHPITCGMADWDMVDETYNMYDATEGSEVLLTTEHPECMRTIAWTRTHGKARVFSLQSGHDDQTYSNPNFAAVVARGIQWAARKI